MLVGFYQVAWYNWELHFETSLIQSSACVSRAVSCKACNNAALCSSPGHICFIACWHSWVAVRWSSAACISGEQESVILASHCYIWRHQNCGSKMLEYLTVLYQLPAERRWVCSAASEFSAACEFEMLKRLLASRQGCQCCAARSF